MKNKTLKFLCKVLCLVLVASFVLEAPLMALETIPVNVGGQQFQVSPGQWVSVRQGTQIVHYNVRYVNGRPVALEMSQYVKLIFGDASSAAGAAGSAGSTGSSGSSSAGSSSSASGKPSTSGSSVSGGSSSTGGSSVSGGSSSSSGSSAQVSTSEQTASNNIRKLPQRDPVTGRFVKSTDSSTSTTTNSNTSTSNTSTSNTNVSNTSTTNNTTTNNTTSNTTSNTSGNSGAIVADNSNAGTVLDTTADAGAQTSGSSNKTWDPAAHPRDPETGRFIKRDSATTGSAQSGQQSSDPVLPSDSDGLGLPGGDADGAGLPSGDSTGQAGQTGEGSQTGQTGQTGQAGDGTQAGQSGQSGEGKSSFKDKMGEKFHSGYETGKTLTNQGFQNVKDSLKSGFSAKNILVTAGITVGVDLATQIMRGEKPSAKKALKTVCSAEFAGGVVGSVTGAAAGSFFVPFLSAVPVVGGFLGALAPTFGSIVGGSVGSYLAGDLKNGRFSIREAFKRIDWIGVAGQTVGSTVGAMLGSAIFPPFGTIIGGMVGGYVGNWAAHKIAGIFGKDKNANTQVAMPTGSNPLGADTSMNGSVTIGEQSGQTSGSVADNSDVLTIPGDTTTGQIGTYESEVQLAYSRYQELYNLYNELTKQGRQEDAKKIIVEMNAAKAQFDQLKAKGSK